MVADCSRLRYTPSLLSEPTDFPFHGLVINHFALSYRFDYCELVAKPVSRFTHMPHLPKQTASSLQGTRHVSGSHHICHAPGRAPTQRLLLQSKQREARSIPGGVSWWEKPGVCAQVTGEAHTGRASAPLGNLAFSVQAARPQPRGAAVQSGGQRLTETPGCHVPGGLCPCCCES